MIDAIIVVAFVTYSVAAGLRSRVVASKGLDEYFLAGRTLSGWRSGLSMSATQYAADTPLLAAGLIATAGIFSLWRLWIYGLAFLMMGFVLGRAWRRAGVLTDAELVAVRYSGKGVTALRGLKAVYFGTLINCTVLAMVLVAATRICETFLPWHDWLPPGLYEPLRAAIAATGIELASGVSGLTGDVATANNVLSLAGILAFVGMYSTTGGLRAVVTTDVAQISLALVATLAYAIYAVAAAGGLGAMLASIERLYGRDRAHELLALTPSAGEALMPFLVIVSLQWFFQMNSDGTGYLAQRTMACRSDADAAQAGFVFAWMQIVLRSILWLPIGVALLVIYPFDPGQASGETFTASRELLFVTGIRDLLPIGIKGLMLTGLLAALSSTIDTHLNWGASYWSNDLYGEILSRRVLKREPSSREIVLVARLSNLLILATSLVIMANLGSIQAAWHISLLFGAGIGSVLVLRWIWERVNLYSEIVALATSLVLAPALLVWTDTEWLRLLLMAAVSTAAVTATALVTRPTDAAVLDSFYRRVRPPGWWRTAAGRAGESADAPLDRLTHGAILVITTASTIYLTLIGLTRVLLPLPGESLLRGLAYLALAAATVPLWRHRLDWGAAGTDAKET